MITAGDCGKGDDLATAVCGWIGRNHPIQPVDDQTVAFFVCYQTNAAFPGIFQNLFRKLSITNIYLKS